MEIDFCVSSINNYFLCDCYWIKRQLWKEAAFSQGWYHPKPETDSKMSWFAIKDLKTSESKNLLSCSAISKSNLYLLFYWGQRNTPWTQKYHIITLLANVRTTVAVLHFSTHKTTLAFCWSCVSGLLANCKSIIHSPFSFGLVSINSWRKYLIYFGKSEEYCRFLYPNISSIGVSVFLYLLRRITQVLKSV